jgi:hypothetical protein
MGEETADVGHTICSLGSSTDVFSTELLYCVPQSGLFVDLDHDSFEYEQ